MFSTPQVPVRHSGGSRASRSPFFPAGKLDFFQLKDRPIFPVGIEGQPTRPPPLGPSGSGALDSFAGNPGRQAQPESTVAINPATGLMKIEAYRESVVCVAAHEQFLRLERPRRVQIAHADLAENAKRNG
jgi:hypothetical protein